MMPSTGKVIDYINQLPNADEFLDLEQDTQEKHIFNASETLKSYFGPNTHVKLNERVIALMVLYMTDLENEEYSRLIKNGVSSFSAKDVSVSFKDGASEIPDYILVLLQELNPSLVNRGRVGRLI